jgi:hypothetical protein
MALPNFVQAAHAFGGGTAVASYPVTINNVAAGDALVLGVSLWLGSTPTVSAQDQNGNQFSFIVIRANGIGLVTAALVLFNSPGGNRTITVSFSTNAAYPMLSVREYANLGAIDVFTSNFSGTASSALSSGNITTTQAPDMLVGFGAVHGGGVASLTPGSGFGNPDPFANIVFFHNGADLVVSTVGVYSATFTANTGGGDWTCLILALYAPTPPPTVVVQAPPPGGMTTQNPTISYPNAVALGNLLVLNFDWWNNLGGVASVTDNLGNNWIQVAYQSPAGTNRTEYTYATVVTRAGPCTITVMTDASRAYTWSIFEVKGALTTLDGAPVYTSATTGTTAVSTGVLTTAKPYSLVFAFTRSGAISVSPASPWNAQSTGGHGSAYQVAATPGSFSANWTSSLSSTYATTILAFQAGIPPSAVTTGVGDTFFTLLAKGNKALGGTGTTPSDNEFTLLAKQFRLLGGSGAQANTSVFILLARINKQLGGTGTTPSDNIFTLLAKQNRLLGGSGATASDTVFTLLAKNSKLL